VIAPVGAEHRAGWDTFVASHPNGSFYHLFDWKAINEQELKNDCEYVAARGTDGRMVGVLPLVFVRSRIFGKILCSLPFVNYGGPLADNSGTAAKLAEYGAARAKELRADYLELRCTEALDVSMPVSLRKVSLTVQLTANPEALYESFSRKHRKNIRSAQKNDLEVRSGGLDLVDDFYRILERSWRGLGTPLYAPRYFRRVLETFPENTTVFVCYHRGAAVGAALTGHFNGVVEGMWAGGRPELRHLDANYVLYWEMLRHACAAGHQRFHLGRSTSDSGAEQFKTKWNAEAHQLHWYFSRPNGGPMPELNVDNPKYRLAISIWRRLPLWATRVIGPRIARSIP
jgi:FemAB-related protein (PEP-CTERM system-associated)